MFIIKKQCHNKDKVVTDKVNSIFMLKFFFHFSIVFPLVKTFISLANCVKALIYVRDMTENTEKVTEAISRTPKLSKKTNTTPLKAIVS